MTKKRYDKPPEGYQRYTVYIKTALLERFKKVANAEDKSLVQAVEEAIENWTNWDGDKHE